MERKEAIETKQKLLHLKLLIPTGVFTEKFSVKRIVVETVKGSYGLLPRRLDCVTALVPGILTYETEEDVEVYVAVDEGIMVKAGQEVLVSVRNAIAGRALGKLKEAVEEEIKDLDEREQDVRLTLSRLESNLIRQFQKYLKE